MQEKIDKKPTEKTKMGLDSTKPLSFAEKILQKHGWCQGQGLGKYSQGISDPIKPNLKFDKTGVGHDPAKEFTDTWWSDAYKQAADNVVIGQDQDGDINVSLKKEKKDKKSLKRSLANSQYTSFVQSSTLDGGKMIDNPEKEKDEKTQISLNSSTSNQKTLTDEELFAACGGLTAHKGARHGHKMSGKQRRLEMQEAELMIQMQKTYNIGPQNPNSITSSYTTEVHKMDSTVVESKMKKSKSKKHKKDKYCDSQKLEIDKSKVKDLDENTEHSLEFVLQKKKSEIKSKRKKKKDKSKSDTKTNVTEISKEVAVIKKKSKKDKKKRKENREK